ncbi:hypothetical protein SAY86_017216 [Trapa natans]|uniref:CTLH/CRA C-terminal to LisH motif domain-containing protein n=1 Tax=Trapa natans TaxID=22666 RepID=A0AAN7LQ09_TRANT|nr:hypothetical protein SAY86_017216 [Trapa natans]
MGCLLFAGKPEASPYAELLRTLSWDKLVAQVTQQYFNLLGQPAESPLSVTIAAGFQAPPTLLKFINGMLGKKQDWHSLKQLPVPVELDDKFQFHSIFICPVSKEPATEDDPPSMYGCGHIICLKSTLVNMCHTDSLKCLYCKPNSENWGIIQLTF